MILRRLSLSHPVFSPESNTVVTIGNFDGFHLGHQKILSVVQSLAAHYHHKTLLLTFEPYPQAFFHPQISAARLTTLREKIHIIPQLADIRYFYALPFDHTLSQMSAKDFIEHILIQQLHVKHIVIGEDFRFGCQRKGDVSLLDKFNNIFHTHVMPPVKIEEERISSTRVREALSAGKLSLAQALLGRHYSMIGRVVQGQQRGRQLGFPTANIDLNKRVPPLSGVFAVKINHQFSGVANVGSRPTVDGKQLFLEVHIFDFSQDIYGQYIEVEFLHKIRDEIRFDSLDALKHQIAKDVAIAKKILNNNC